MSTPSNSHRTLLLDIEIGNPISDIHPIDPAVAKNHPRALALVRLHTQPLGMIELSLDEDCLSGEKQVQKIWSVLQNEISAHLIQDGWAQNEINAIRGKSVPEKPSQRCLQPIETVRDDPPLASIILATRDRAMLLAGCIRSLTIQDYPNYEIIVVDNAPSSSSTFDLVQEIQAQHPHIRYVLEPQPGLAVARNCGFREAKGSIAAFMDDDVRVDRHWLSRLVQGFSVANNVACVTGLIIPAKLETATHVWFEWFGRFNKGYSRRIFDLEKNRINNPLYPFAAGTFGTGANMAYKTSFLHTYGGFDPALGIGSASRGGEDLAMFYQVIKSGHQLVYEPGAIVFHSHRKDYPQLQKQVFNYGVGLTAYLTKILIDQPSLIFAFMRRIPSGLFHIFSSQSLKNKNKPPDFPHELTSLEWRGMLLGPIAYLRSRWHIARDRKDFEHARS